MAEFKYAQSFKDLIVYQKALAVSNKVFEISKGFPKEETYSLTDQVRRSSRSIGAQIAEAWGKRRYERHFISKLTDADAEQLETQHWVNVARSCGYIKDEDMKQLKNNLEEIGRMIHSMVQKADLFCITASNKICEPDAEYGYLIADFQKVSD